MAAENWPDVFRCFVAPGVRLNLRKLQLGIDFQFETQDGQPLNLDDPAVKAMIESARQLGLELNTSDSNLGEIVTAKEDLITLDELLKKFEVLDAGLIESVINRNFGMVDQTIAAKKKIKRFLSERKPLNVGPDVAVKLKRIRDNYGNNVDFVLEKLTEFTGEQISQEEENEIDWIDELFATGTADYVDQKYFRRKNEVATLIVNQSLPENFLAHFGRVRECYSLGLFETAYVYCRSVIETGCFEFLKRKGRIKTQSNMTDWREYRLRPLMDSIKPFVYIGIWDEADKVIKAADKILHSKREKIVTSEGEALGAIRSTFAIIEELFK